MGLSAGEYSGEIIDASINESSTGGAPYAQVKLKAPEGISTWFGSFSETVIKSGNNQGKTVGDVTAATLGSFGWKGDFSNLSPIVGQKCVFGVKVETDAEGKSRDKVSYFRPMGAKKPVSKATASELASKFKASALEAAKNAPALPVPPPSDGTGSGDFDDADVPF